MRESQILLFKIENHKQQSQLVSQSYLSNKTVSKSQSQLLILQSFKQKLIQQQVEQSTKHLLFTLIQQQHTYPYIEKHSQQQYQQQRRYNHIQQQNQQYIQHKQQIQQDHLYQFQQFILSVIQILLNSDIHPLVSPPVCVGSEPTVMNYSSFHTGTPLVARHSASQAPSLPVSLIIVPVLINQGLDLDKLNLRIN